ncbi:MAG TPA: TadE/TadG family type IV pilus assembly protein [Afipia sp.]
MTLLSRVARLRHDRSGIAMVEFAVALPFLVIVMMTAAELANFTTTKMRVSQLALQIADNASRIGTGTVLSNKTISEKQINELLTGANVQAGKLGLFANGRIILSSLQPGTSANTYVVKWQRCKGLKNFTSSNYFTAGTTQRNTISNNPYKVTPPTDGAVMFVEISYNYQSLIASRFRPLSEIRETAAMTVRDNRDYTGGTNGIYNTESATVANCSTFSST